MAMLSALLRYMLVDEQQREARLYDLAVDLSAGDYPPLTDALVRQSRGRGLLRLPVPANVAADRHRRRLCVEDLAAAAAPDPDWLAQAVLLKRDILDAMVVDLRERMAYRANDLWIEEKDGRYVLTAVDVSFRAIIRRVSRGRIGDAPPRLLHDWRTTEFLRGDPLAAEAGRDYHRLIGRLPAGEIANLADALPYLHAAELLMLLPDAKAADTLESMMPERQLQVFEELADSRARRLLSLMRPDIVADLLGRLEKDEARYWLEHMPALQYGRVLALLRYPEDTAGGIMTNDLIALPAGVQAGAALGELRRKLGTPDFINFIHIVYVVDNPSDRRLQGVLSLRDLLVADEGKPLEEIMDPYVVALQPNEPAVKAARSVIENGLPALPVLGEAGELVGAVTVDAALTFATPAGWGRRQAPRLFS
ncbi:MAG: magnesium transporter MgtE N-terminal domain-containing protein [Nitrososphaerales archaeon]